MSNKKTVLRILALVATLLAVSGTVFFLIKAYRYFESEDKTVLSVVSPETAMVVRCDNVAELETFIHSGQACGTLFLSPENARCVQSFVAVTLSQPYMDDIVKSCPLYLLLCSKLAKWQYVYVWEIGKKNDKAIERYMAFLGHTYPTEKLSYKQCRVFKTTFGRKTLYYTYNNGLIIFSMNEQMMYASLNHLLLADNQTSTSFGQLIKTADRNTAFHLYIQNDVLENHIKTNKPVFLDPISWNYLSVCRQSALDLSFKNGKIILSGYMILDSTTNRHPFYSKRSSFPDYYTLLPRHTTAVFALFGNDFNKLTSLYTTKIGSYEDFLSMMKPNSIITFKLQNNTAANFILMRSDEVEEAKFHLFNCVNNTFERNMYKMDTSYYEGLMIGGIDIPNFFLSRLELSPEIKRLKAFTVMDNYILFSDSDTNIRQYISLIKNNEFITADSNFMQSDFYFQEETNMLYYKEMDRSNKGSSSGDFFANIKSYRWQLTYYKNNKLFFTLMLDPK